MCKQKNLLCQYCIIILLLMLSAIGCVLVFSYWRQVTLTIVAFYIGGFTFLLVSKCIHNGKTRKMILFAGIFILLSTLLFHSYMLNSMQPHNSSFWGFQEDSELLVHDAILAANKGDYEGQFGLGRYNHNYEAYVSQYGLQGKVFSAIGKLLRYDHALLFSNMLCALLTAIVFVMITLLIRKKWGDLMAVCYYLTFWLSPWIVNFARNLYWVEFTWFVPLLLGLFCSVYVDKKYCRIFSVGGVFVSILIKSLCGYEYISTIMMAMISFLFLDMVKALLEKDRKEACRLFKTTFAMGLSAVLGFVFALLIHAFVRGEGNITAGLSSIYINDVMRRVSVSVDPGMFGSVYTESLQADLLTVLRQYLCFSTDILLGLDGKTFSVLAVLPILFFVFRYIRNTLDWNDVFMYIVLFLTSISWLVLAKPHSYIHTHMNYVLWYFGFVQICLYLICKYILLELRERNSV